MTIDTLKVARRLREAGFSEPQAEAVVEAVRDGADDGHLATKQDLSFLAVELRGEIAALRGDFSSGLASVRAEMREMEQRIIAEMVSRMFAMVVGAVLVNIVAMLGAIFAFAKLLGH